MKKRIRIDGMHCTGCVQSVEKAIKSVAEVNSVSVQLTTEQAEIEIDGEDFPWDEIRTVVEDAGYKIEAEKNDSVMIEIEGMHCTGCSSAIEKALNRNKGVINASVNLTAEKAYIDYDATLISVEELKESIEQAGYNVVEAQKKK